MCILFMYIYTYVSVVFGSPIWKKFVYKDLSALVAVLMGCVNAAVIISFAH